MSLSEAVGITAGDSDVIARVSRRECARTGIMRCMSFEIPQDARAFATDVELMIAQSIAGLQGLLRSMKELPDRKTLVVVSGGLMSGHRIGGRLDMNRLISNAGRQAAEANVNLYVLHLDTSFLEVFSPQVKAVASMLDDVELRAQGSSGSPAPPAAS